MLQSSLLMSVSFGYRLMGTMSKSLIFCAHGCEVIDILRLAQDEVPCPKGHEVLVKMIASPIHPIDLDIIQGNYPCLPKLPATGGNEGVGKVVAFGEKVKNLCEGQKVVFNKLGLGTWREYALFPQDVLYPITRIPMAEAATFVINPSTAYRMLKDYVKLKAGDTVIQNGANSAVGQTVHQLCRYWKYKSVGIVRDRPDIDEVKKYLKCLGATEVLTEEELCETNIFQKKFKKPKLGLNSIGGLSAMHVANTLDCHGVLVTYGNMSRKPFAASSPNMIYKNLAYRGFWLQRWLVRNQNSKEQKKMFKFFTTLIEKGKLCAPKHEFISLDDYKDAGKAFSFDGCQGKKTIFKLDCGCY